MTLATPDSIACMEDPGYRGARARRSRVRPRASAPIAVDKEGIDVAAITRLGGTRTVRLRDSFASVSASAFRSGSSRRLELLGWAERNESWILEDDYDSEFRLFEPDSRLPAGDGHR